jgi:tRNA-modifying protein YgfZ
LYLSEDGVRDAADDLLGISHDTTSVARHTGDMESSNATPWFDDVADAVVVEGPDALSYLQGQVSQDIGNLSVGERRWTFLLQPTGKIDVLARLTRTGDETFTLETDPGFGDSLLARVDRFKIRVKVETTLVPGPGAGAVTPEAERARIDAGWPRMGAEIVPGENIPAETGVTPLAVNFRKGCYPGQELVERMDSRGASAPRSLRRLVVPAGTSVGDPVHDADGAEVGVITSVAGTSALGYVKRGADVGDPVVHEPTPTT